MDSILADLEGAILFAWDLAVAGSREAALTERNVSVYA